MLNFNSIMILNMETNDIEYNAKRSIYQPTIFEFYPDLEVDVIEIGEPDETCPVDTKEL